MFVGLKHPLAAGGHVAATLNFEKAGSVKVEYDVLAMGASPGHTMPGMRVCSAMRIEPGWRTDQKIMRKGQIMRCFGRRQQRKCRTSCSVMPSWRWTIVADRP